MADTNPGYVKRTQNLTIKQGDTLLGPTFVVRMPDNIDLNTTPGTTAYCDLKKKSDGTLVGRWVWTPTSVTFQLGAGSPTSYSRSDFFLQYIDKDGNADNKAASVSLLIEEADSANLPLEAELEFEVKFRFPWSSGNTDDLTFFAGFACIVKEGADAP